MERMIIKHNRIGEKKKNKTKRMKEWKKHGITKKNGIAQQKRERERERERERKEMVNKMNFMKCNMGERETHHEVAKKKTREGGEEGRERK